MRTVSRDKIWPIVAPRLGEPIGRYIPFDGRTSSIPSNPALRVRARLVNPCPRTPRRPCLATLANASKFYGLLVAKGADDGFDFVAGFIGTPLGVNRRRILRDNRARFGLSTTER